MDDRKDQIKNYLTRHSSIAKELGLEVDAEGLLLRETRPFDYQGVKTTLIETAGLPLAYCDIPEASSADNASRPWVSRIRGMLTAKSQAADAARLWLTHVKAELQAKLPAPLADAEEALKALIDTVLRPGELPWLGGEEAARAKYLATPDSLAAHEAAAGARRRQKEALAAASKKKLELVATRLREHTEARLNGKTLLSRYQEALPFRGGSLTLDLNVEKAVERSELDRLVAAADTELAATVDAVLSQSRQGLKLRVQLQLDELARQIKALPHIELLSDADVASVVEPYYGGLNRALKKRRARTALVAVEERAREAKYQDDVAKLNEHRDAYADVAAYYPLARSLTRRLVLYVGPTNSGKTWRALNDLAESGSGAYLAPLRLLALEGQEELEKRGKLTSFITGEERDLKPGSHFTSSTIEMLNPEIKVDAVVVDEVQLLADERRGWAWLAAVVGAPAEKVIMTGSPDCVDIVKDLASYLGEELTIHECQRYNELHVAPEPIRLRDITPGTAIVCFSRRDVLRIKDTIQDNSDHKVAVVYGNLSPQVRREEARRFRSGEADILVATDAIAMGLNLPIKEVVFYTTEKFNGEEVTNLTPSEIRQIGGRAGRYGVAQFGMVHALNPRSLTLIKNALRGSAEMLTPPYFVAPGPNHIRVISKVLGTTSLERILTFFDKAIEFSDERFARSNIDDLSYLSTFVDERLPFLPVDERLTIASAPVAIRNDTVVSWFLERMLPAFSGTDEAREGLDELFEEARAFERDMAKNQIQLRNAEDYLKALTVYAWLAYRYPDVFTKLEECEVHREAVNAFVERSLHAKAVKTCAACGVKLPSSHQYPTCEECHAKGRKRRDQGQRQGQGGRQGQGRGRGRRQR